MRNFCLGLLAVTLLSVHAQAVEKTAKRGLASDEVTVELSYDGAKVWTADPAKKISYPAYLGMTLEVDQMLEDSKKSVTTCSAKVTRQSLKLKEGGMDSQYLRLLKIWELRDCK